MTSREVLKTKLYPPPARAKLVPRPRLTARLKEPRALILIAAPAGFGKTTLLSEWIPQSEHCVAWLSLDDDDNDPARFWTCFVAALQTLRTDLGAGALLLLQGPQTPSIRTILTTLLNEIAAFEHAFSIVLDDYHAIQAPAIHDGLMFLLDHQPPQMQVVVTSRADLPLPLAHLRARNQLTELRADDLRFTPDEAAAFLNQVMGLTLSAVDIGALEVRTEGWVAGLQLAALSLQGRADGPAFIRAFSGSHRHVLSFLVEEVLNRRPTGTLDFLLQTSILDRLCGPLCDAVTGGHDSQALLEKLEQANLFIVRLDDAGQWYRYHHLFAEVLQARLAHTQPDLVSEGHRRASAWLEQSGSMDEAVRHALAAGDFDRAAQLVERVAPAMMQRGELARLLAWLDGLPDGAVQGRPLLGLYFGWCLLLSGKITQAAGRLEAIEAALATDQAKLTPVVQSHIAAMRARLLREAGDLAGTIVLSQQALAQLPEQDTLLRPRIALDLTIAYYLQGEFEPASRLLTETIASGQTTQHLLGTLSALYMYTQLLRAQGGLRRALKLCREELALVAQHRWHDIPATGFLYIAFGELLRERNELAAAADYLERAIKLGQEGGNPFVSIIGHVWLSWLRQTQGDASGSHQAIEAALELVQHHQVSRFWPMPSASGYQARAWIAQGNLGAASRWAQASGLDTAQSPDTFRLEAEYLTLARLQIAQGNLEAADALLHRLHQAAALAGRGGSLIEIFVLQAITFAAQQRRGQALAALAQALALAEPEGFLRVFLDEGPAVRDVVGQWRLEKGRQKALTEPDIRLMAYADKLLAAFSAELADFPNAEAAEAHVRFQDDPTALVEPLSGRELEVLRLMAAGASNSEIARRLSVTLNTVKKHSSHILAKLDVTNRTQAAARAREWRLL